MTTFDDREKAMEAKFAHDADLEFRVLSRRNKMVAEWAGGKLGLVGAGLADYVKAVLHAAVTAPGGNAVAAKLRADFAARGLAVTDTDIQQTMSHLLHKALVEIESGTP